MCAAESKAAADVEAAAKAKADLDNLTSESESIQEKTDAVLESLNEKTNVSTSAFL